MSESAISQGNSPVLFETRVGQDACVSGVSCHCRGSSPMVSKCNFLCVFNRTRHAQLRQKAPMVAVNYFSNQTGILEDKSQYQTYRI